MSIDSGPFSISPCPFCGGKARYTGPAYDKKNGHIACLHCGATIYSSDSEKGVIAMWNRRVEPPFPQGG